MSLLKKKGARNVPWKVEMKKILVKKKRKTRFVIKEWEMHYHRRSRKPKKGGHF